MKSRASSADRMPGDQSVSGFVAWIWSASVNGGLLVGAVQRQNRAGIDLRHANAAIGFRGSEFAITELAFNFHIGAFLQSAGPFAQLIPADDAMPFHARLYSLVPFSFQLTLVASEKRVYVVPFEVERVSAGWPTKPMRVMRFLQNMFWSSFRAPIRRGDPVRRGPFSKRARDVFRRLPAILFVAFQKA